MNVEVNDRNRLFGILALKIDLISQDQLLDAFRELTDSDRATDPNAMQEILLNNGSVPKSLLPALDALVDAQLIKQNKSYEQNKSPESSLTGDPSQGFSLHIQPAQLSNLFGAEKNGNGFNAATLSLALGQPTADGRFQILRPYAKGGLGEVYVALDQELGREVALKKILGDSIAEEKRERFVREAEVTGKLEHPGIVPVYGMGTDSDGNPYYAMRLIRGQSLRDAIKKYHERNKESDRDKSERNKEFRKLLNCFVDVCNAISYAHSRGVLHRDIKPANIMMGRYGETLVVDWGIARVAGVEDKISTSTDERPLTATKSGFSSKTLDGQAIGTPAYMSPEQANGRLDQLGPHTDVYGLGASLYAILAGQAPYQGDTTDVINRVIQGDFPPPSKIESDIPKPLESVCLKAMSHDAWDRYETPLELAAEIEAWMADEPVVAFAEPFTFRASRWIRHHQSTVAAVAATILVLLGAAILSSFLLRSKNAELTTASDMIRKKNDALIESNIEETKQRERADRVKDYLVDIFEKTDPNSDGRALTLAELLDSSMASIDADFNDDPLTQADLYYSVGRSYLGLGLYQEALSAHEKELAIRTEHQEINEVARLRASYQVANSLWRLSEYDRALEIIQPTLELQTKTLGKQNADTLNSMNMVALCYQSKAKPAESLAIFAELVDLRKDLGGADSSEYLMAVNNLAAAHSRNTDYEKALQLYETNLEKRKNLHGENHLKTLQAKSSYASTIRLMGRFEQAIKMYQEVVEQRVAQLGETHPDTIAAKDGLVLSLQQNGQHEQVIPIVEEILQVNRQTMGENHENTLRSLNTLGQTLVSIGDYPKAIEVFTDALARYEEKHGNDHDSTMSLVNNLAYTYRSNGEYRKAIPLFKRAYENRLANLEEGHDKIIISYNNWALALESNGDMATAVPMLKQSYEMWKAKAGPDRPNTLSSARMLGSTYRRIGEYQKSLAILEPTREKQTELFANDHPHALYTAVSLAKTLNKLNRSDEAMEIARFAAQTFDEKFGMDHPQTWRALNVQAAIHLDLGQPQLALDLLKQTLSRYRQKLGSEHPATLQTMSQLGRAYSALDQVDLADQFFEKALQQQTEKLGEKHRKTFETKMVYIEHLMKQQRHALAEKWLTQLWSELPTAAERNLFPVEQESRKWTINRHLELYDTTGDEDKLNEWNHKQ